MAGPDDNTTQTDTPPPATPNPSGRAAGSSVDDDSDETGPGEVRRKKKKTKPVHFNDLDDSQKLIASLFMLLFGNSPDPKKPDGSPDPAAAEERDKILTAVLGKDECVALKQKMKKPDFDFQRDVDFSHFKDKEAQKFNEAVTGIKLQTGERQTAVLGVMDDAAKRAEISYSLLSGIWGVESHFGQQLHSPTGCEGDFQFTKGTFAAEIKGKGDTIAAALRAQGQDELAARVEHYSQGLKNGSIKTSDSNLQALRDDPRVSTYAAAFYLKDVAASVHADAKSQQNFGIIYAGYNIGPAGARSLEGSLAHTNAMSGLGYVAAVNPQFFKGGATGEQALQNYQNTVMSFAKSFDKSVATTSVAKTIDPGKAGSPSSRPVFNAAGATPAPTVAQNTPASTAPGAKNVPVTPAAG